MNIKPVKSGYNRYCGPSAISALTGVNTDVAAALLRSCNGRQSIKGAYNYEMRHALGQLGYTMTISHERRSATFSGGTFAAWLRSSRKERGRRAFLVNIGHHYVVIQGRTFIDNHRTDGCLISEAPYRRATFKCAWEITKTGKGSGMAKALRRKYDPIKREPRPAKPEPTKDELRSKKLGLVELKLKRWNTRLKRAQTAIRKLTRSKGALLRAVRPANDAQMQLAA